jgi:hypothetical protein
MQAAQNGCWGLPADRLPLYFMQTTHNDDATRNGVSFDSVLMRGHVHELTEADRALFDPPSDYTPIE